MIEHLPHWISQGSSPQNQGLHNLLGLGHKKSQVLTTKYCGDHLESLSLAHWLAQGHSLPRKNAPIICP